ncbi:MAG TPA: isochorismate synthase [Polyangiaceae bacterium]|nr:isochorismate synthase [Polyangiaceae bacterium]
MSSPLSAGLPDLASDASSGAKSSSATLSPSLLVQALREALREARPRQGRARFHVLNVAAGETGIAGHAWLRLEGIGSASFLSDPTGYEQSAIEQVEVLTAAGPERFQSLATQAQALFEQIDDPSESLRLIGGFAFQPARASSELFRNFGEARFVLPRLIHERRDGQARLSLVVRDQELADAMGQANLLSFVERVLQHATKPRRMLQAGGEDPSDASSPRVDAGSEADFTALVERSRDAILRRELEKVVLARRVDVELPDGVEPDVVLERLAASAPECIRYAFMVAGRTFLGATPERLVRKSGGSFETEAVAGSIPINELSALRLLESTKDRAEQAIVVREVLQSLRPLCATLEPAETPEIHRLRHVAHLRTRIRGKLLRPEHVLELVARLHPTPAVGGFPSARAQAWIAEHEPAERGWYSGPIGWFDRHGDGAFMVALRCGVLHGRHAALFAGAGIVEGSKPESELQETRWKLQGLLGALGVTA